MLSSNEKKNSMKKLKKNLHQFNIENGNHSAIKQKSNAPSPYLTIVSV